MWNVMTKCDMMICYLVFSIALALTKAEKYFEIDDIPIEHFEHEDIESDAIDVELMPRSPRSFQNAVLYPKDYSDSDLSPNDRNVEVIFENLPESQGFFPEYPQGFRSKRQVFEPVAKLAKDPLKVLKELGKPLELSVIEPENKKDPEENNSTTVTEEDENNLLINDFIRFRRSAKQSDSGSTSLKDINRSTNEQKSLHLQNPFRNFSRTERLGGPPAPKDISRETRGITREQWVRHVYPVGRDDELTYDDNVREPSADDRAMRVHFVTEGMSGAVPADQKYDRQARARSLNREISRNLARDSTPDMDFNQPRYTRNYNPWPARRNRYDQDPNDFRDPYQRPYDGYAPTPNRRRRIIYYATLPDPPRQGGDYKDRYDDYRDIDRYYDDRRFSHDPYRYRQEYFRKPGYEDKRAKKPEYPVKVTTDVNIRDVKKNPERVYSDVTRTRYAANDMY